MIFLDAKDYDHYICCGNTDMRLGSQALAYVVRDQLGMDVFGKSIFLFCGSRGRIVKVLVWDNGLVLLHKLSRKQNNLCMFQNPVPSQRMHLIVVLALEQKMNSPPCRTSIFICS
jgi:hypothetical protein